MYEQTTAAALSQHMFFSFHPLCFLIYLFICLLFVLLMLLLPKNKALLLFWQKQRPKHNSYYIQMMRHFFTLPPALSLRTCSSLFSYISHRIRFTFIFIVWTMYTHGAYMYNVHYIVPASIEKEVIALPLAIQTFQKVLTLRNRFHFALLFLSSLCVRMQDTLLLGYESSLVVCRSQSEKPN